MTTVRQLLDGKSPEVHAVAPDAAVIDAIGQTLAGAASDPAFVAEAVLLPSEAFIGDQMVTVDPDAIRRERLALQAAMLLRAASPAAGLFVRSRLGSAHGLAFGTLPDDVDLGPLLARALPA